MSSVRRSFSRSRVATGPAAALIVLAAALGAPLHAEEPAVDPVQALIADLRREIEDLKRRVAALTEKLDRLSADREGAAAPDRLAAAEPPAVPETIAAPPAVAPAPAGPRARNIFNPEISVVFLATGSDSLEHDREEDGFSLSEAEISFQGAIDPYARVDLFVALNSEGEAEVEEGYVSTLALPGGLKFKGGRFKNAFGKWNTLHDHQFPAVVPPDALTAFFGEESLNTDGGSLSWLIPGPLSTWVESITEIGSTGNDVSFNGESRDLMLLQHLGAVFTLTPHATIGAGATGAFGKAGPTDALLDAIEEAGLTGMVEPDGSLSSHVYGADVTWKWKPARTGRYRSAMVQAEAFRSRRRAESLTPAMTLARDTIRSAGGYVYGEYQFARRWRAGLIWDTTQSPGDDGHHERSISALMRITPTEFQEIRIQFKRTSRNAAAAALFDGEDDEQVIFVQWVPVLGAHPAHVY